MTLVVDSIGRTIGRTLILDTVSFEVPAGSRLALVGPSGSGKTTLLRIIGGFDRADTGTVRLGNRTLSDRETHVPPRRRRIGYVPQEGALFPHLTAAANIGFGVPRARRRIEVERIAQIAGVPLELLPRFPHELSGGQQQRVALGRALATDPLAVLLDEPFSALDTGLRSTTRDAVVEVLDRAAVTTILVTHDQTEALQFGQAIGVLEGGRLVQHDAPDRVFRAPATLAVHRFLGPSVEIPAVVVDGIARSALGSHLIDHDTRDDRSADAVAAFRPNQLSVRADPDGTARIRERRDEGSRITLRLEVEGRIVEADLPRHASSGLEPGGTASIAVSGGVNIYPAA